MNRKSGFTLIEIIVTLTLVGLISTGIVMIFYPLATSFNTGKTTLTAEQDLQYAISRITKELNLMKSLKIASGNTLSFNPTPQDGRLSTDIYMFTIENNNMVFKINDISYTFLKNVATFSVSKINPNIVKISIQMNIGNTPKTFETSVAIR